jgi:hypothetical protein
LTKPGPFAARTIELGSYIGVRSGSHLVAMAGERMRFDGFTEISAVCTHPDHRGRGHARLLVRALMRDIVARGETPFLHIYSENAGAAALYRGLGFRYLRSLTVTVLKRPDQSVVRALSTSAAKGGWLCKVIQFGNGGSSTLGAALGWIPNPCPAQRLVPRQSRSFLNFAQRERR